MDDLGNRYLTLALQLERHVPGYIDAYYGPPALKEQAGEGEPRAPAALVDDTAALLAGIEVLDGTGQHDAQRKDYLWRQTRAMHALASKLAGGAPDFMTEVRLSFDIEPDLIGEEVFGQAHGALEALLPGSGPLAERLAAWKRRLELAPERILPVCERARSEARQRTAELFELPPGEAIELQVVKNEPWGAYNWYLGDYRSRIDLNTDLPMHINSVVGLMAHEAYPGHHTEHAIKEQRLYRGEGRAEHAAQLILAPEATLSEGIADSARAIVFDDEGLAAFLHDELYPLAGLDPGDVERQIRIDRAAEPLSGVAANGALLLHRDGRPPAEVQRYIERNGLRSEREAAQNMKFIQHPLWRSYIFNYGTGKRLLAPLLEGPNAASNFRRLLNEPFTPTQVRQWSERG